MATIPALEPLLDEHADDPMWSEEFAIVAAQITYKPGHRLLLRPDAAVPGGRWYFQVEAERTDAITGESGVGRGGKAYLSPHATRSELVQTAFGLFKAFEEHECREFFQWRGRRVFGPHIDVRQVYGVATSIDARPSEVDL